MKVFLHILSPILLIVSSLTAMGQYSIESAYEQVRQNYPMIKNKNLIEQTKEFTLDNLAKGYLPQLSFNAQATYQSDVTALPIELPNVNVPQVSKDQYKIYGEIVQPLTAATVIKPQKRITEANAAVQQEQLEVELYQLRNRVNQLFFSILLTDERIVQTQLMMDELNANLKKVEAAVTNGTAVKNNLELLKAETINARQQIIEFKSQRKSLLSTLSLLTGQVISEETTLIKPEYIAPEDKNKRPELALFSAQRTLLNYQNELQNAEIKPRVSLFLQAGYGRPALNFLSNELDFYYLGGVRLNWNLSAFYTAKNNRNLIATKQQTIQLQEDTFRFNNNLESIQKSAEILKYEELLTTDDELIKLRESIKNRAEIQLEGGIITATDYISFVNAAAKAKQQKATHEIQLALARYDLKNTKGN